MSQSNSPVEHTPEGDRRLQDTVLEDLIHLAFGWTVQVFDGHPQRETAGLTLAQEVVATTVCNAWGPYRLTYDPTRYLGKRCPFQYWLRLLVAWEAWRTLQRQRRRLPDQDAPPAV